MTRTMLLRTLLVAALLGTAGLVAACAAPRATVASTGASIPVNDRPTLVFVDAIW